MSQASDARCYAPAAERNREPILDVLLQVLLPEGTVLEISSGTGQHAAFFAPRLRPRFWLPSDPDALARASIAAWRSHTAVDNLLPPLKLDVRDRPWPVEADLNLETSLGIDVELPPIVAIVNINMIHIAPWSACVGLMAGARRILPPGGILYMYGPFLRDDVPTAPSNEAFDHSLRAQNPEWGIRNLRDVAEVAKTHGLSLLETYSMPANNLSVIFRADAA